MNYETKNIVRQKQSLHPPLYNQWHLMPADKTYKRMPVITMQL